MSRIPSLGPRGEGWVFLQLTLLAAIAVVAISVRSTDDGDIERLAMVVGGILLAFGIVTFLLGITSLGNSLSPLPVPKESAELVDHGIYRFVRHPIYSGLILAATGGSIYAVSFAALLLTAALVVVLDLKSRREEVWLRERFAGYAAYAARTKRFVPGLY